MLGKAEATNYDFALEAISNAEGLMRLATEANRRAHNAENEGEIELRDFWFDRKLGIISLLVLAHKDSVIIRRCNGLISVQISGTGTKLHVPRSKIRTHVCKNGYGEPVKGLLLRIFKQSHHPKPKRNRTRRKRKTQKPE